MSYDIVKERANLKNELKRYDASEVNVRHKRVQSPRHIKRIHFDKNGQTTEILYGTDNMKDRVLRHQHRIQRVKGTHYGIRRRKMKNINRNGKRTVRTDHIHTARNDTKYIDLLLTLDIKLCLLLKHVTNVIEYGWIYSEYC